MDCHTSLLYPSFSTVCLQSLISLQKLLLCSLQSVGSWIMGFHVVSDEITEHCPQLQQDHRPREGRPLEAAWTTDIIMASGERTGHSDYCYSQWQHSFQIQHRPSPDIQMALDGSTGHGHQHIPAAVVHRSQFVARRQHRSGHRPFIQIWPLACSRTLGH